jgi:hypothetical protein
MVILEWSSECFGAVDSLLSLVNGLADESTGPAPMPPERMKVSPTPVEQSGAWQFAG